MKQKITAIFMTLVVAFSIATFSVSSYAEGTNKTTNEKVVERYQVIFDHTSGINIIGLSAECNASMGAQYSTSLSITMELQKLSSGSYSTIKTWTKSKTGTSLELEGSRLINVLSTYRLKTTFTAGNETVVVYSYPS